MERNPERTGTVTRQSTSPSCNGTVSPKAYDCPKCGHPIRKPKRGIFGKLIKLLFIAFNLLMLLWVLTSLGAIADLAGTATSDAEMIGAAIGTTLGFGLIGSIWVIGDVILGLLVLLTRPKK
jgi:hypothetical protein